MYYLLLLAKRYLWSTKQETAINTMVKVCFIGIAIGTFALSLVISVMQGFEKSTHEKIQSINAQIIMNGHGQNLNYEKISSILIKEFPEQVKASTPSCTQNVVLQDQNDNQPIVAAIKGIDPKNEPNVTVLSQKVINNKEKTFPQLLYADQVLVGYKLADQLDININNKIELLFVPEEISSGHKINLSKKMATVSGFIKTGIDEYDNGTIICNLPFLQKMFPDSGSSIIEIKLNDNINETNTITALKKRFHLDIYSWKKLYPALVSALKLEKYAMFFILILITLVASMNMLSLLFMLTTHKKGDIAILKSMGIPDKHVTIIFIIIGIIITTGACIIGLASAFIACLILKYYPFISLPDMYYVTHLPVAIEWPIFALVFVIVFIIGIFASIIPTLLNRKLNIANVLSFER